MQTGLGPDKCYKEVMVYVIGSLKCFPVFCVNSWN